ncbi:MAG: amidohydrolase family protein [bacterium]|nr:amidohydrolase family protein [bacterium]MDE0288273.1 amidohydrolase family protein [bacterium]MDE0439280.1 amidohydrolase family protein [bacterium]
MVAEVAAGLGGGPAPALVLTGATLVDGTGRDAIEDAVVEVVGGRIANVSRRGDIPPAAGSNTVDLSGKTIVPGLIDSHVHLGLLPYNRFGVEDPMPLFDRFMSAFVEYGVTTVRCTGSPDLDWSFGILKEGNSRWPRFYGSGPNLDGPPGGPHPGLRVVRTPEEAVAQTLDLLDNGADFVKVYVWMTGEILRAVVSAAHSRGRKVAAHVGHTLTAEEAVLLGVDALEHVRIGEELLTDEQRAEIAALPVRAHDHLLSFRPWRYIDVESDRAGALLDLLVERGVYLTPTLTLSRSALLNNEDEVREPEGIGRMPHAVIDHWERKGWINDYSAEDWEAAPTEWRRQVEFVGRAYRHGVRIAAGTDMPNPFILPGSGLHDELELLHSTGMPRQAVVEAATRIGAELLGVDRDLGTVEKGKLADLLVVDGNPLEHLDCLRRPWAVLKGGAAVSGSGVASFPTI